MLLESWASSGLGQNEVPVQKPIPYALRRFGSIGFSPTPCNTRQTIADVAQNLGVDLSPSDLNQLAQAIAAGGQAAMALALSIAGSIADANYRLSPQLVNTLMSTLNQGDNPSLSISHLLRWKLIRLPIRKG